VDVVIEPEPSPEEREAIELALGRLLEDEAVPPAYRSAWRRAGIAENVEAD
jgi:hypothetical protein